jgi:hypothetical protein
LDSLFFFLSFAAASTTGVPSSSPRLAVIDDVKTPVGLEHVHEDLRNAIATLARERGFEIVPTNVRACADEACARQAADSDADVVVALSGAYGGKDFVVDVRLFHGAQSRWTTPEPMREDCITGCTRDRLLEHVTSSVGALLASAPPVPPRAPAVVSDPPPIVDVPAAVAVERPSRSHALPISIAAGGAALTVAGAVLWAIDGRNTDCMSGGGPCASRLDTGTLGKPLVVVGAIGMIAGATIYFIRRGAEEPAVALSISPTGLAVRGAF